MGRITDDSKKLTLICFGCGREFQKYKSAVKNNTTGRYFCGLKCQQKVGARPRMGENINCPICGITFYRKLSSVLSDRDNYCSRKCGDIGKTNKKDVFCDKCGQIFSVHQKSNRKYCSDICAGNKSQRVDRSCLNCEKVVVMKSFEKFCSHLCFREYQTANAKGSIKNGYRTIPTGDGRYILEHRYIMEQHIGRKLFKTENVHHLDGDRLNNDISNLELWIVSQPAGQRAQDKIDWALDLLSRYGTIEFIQTLVT